MTFLVADNRTPQFFDDANGFVTNREALGDGVFTLEDVDVGAADGGGGDADQCIVGADIGQRLVGEFDAAGFDEHRRFHHGRHSVLPMIDWLARCRFGLQRAWMIAAK